MNRFSRIRHHVSVEDVKKKRLESIAVENFIKTEEEITKTISEKFKRNWRKELEEGMTTSNALSTVLPAEGETAIDQVSPIDAASFAGSDSFFGPGEFGNNAVAAQKSTQIRSSGSGSGSTGGFDVGGDYLAFQGAEGVGSERWAILKPIDATKVDSITITAIRGTGSNGGEHPDIVGTEELYIRYKTPDMNISRYFTQDRDGNNVGSFPADAAIIGINQGDGTLQNYTITIPEFARQKNVTFALYQKGNSGSQFDHYGVTDIKFQRRTPLNVVVPLDSPEAISFIRVGTNEGDPKKRKKKVNDQLAASDEYVAQQMGGEFPGQGTRIDGEDPFKSAEVQDVTEPSPIGKDEVTKSFADFQQGQKTVEVLKTPEQIEAQNDEYFADLENLLVANEYDYGDPQVLEITDKILKLDPKNVDAYYFKDYYYYINDDMESAKGVVDEMIKNIPDSPDGYSLRSFYKQEEGDLAGAIEDLEKAVELEPDPEYVAYIEMELADLKFQKAELESEAAEKERLESEAGAIEAKAHEDYWNNADLIEQEQPIEYQGDNTTAIDDLGSVFLLRGKLANLDTTSVGDRSKSYDENLAAYNQVLPQIRRKAVDYITNLDTNQFKPESGSDYYVMTYKQQTMDSADEFAKYYATEFEDSEGDPRVYKFYYDAGLGVYKSGFGIGSANPVRSQGGAFAISKIQSMTKDQIIYQFESLLRRHSGKYGLVNDTRGNSFNKNIRETTKRAMGDYLKELAKNLPDDYFDSTEIANPTTLYDQMKALYDEEDPEKEIKTELNELGFDEQFKDLMTAWDSADKFSKFLTPFAALSNKVGTLFTDLFKDGVEKSASVLGEQNMQIAIAKSVLLNRPVRVDPNSINEELKFKLVKDLKSDMFVDENFLEYQKALRESGDTSDISRYEYPQGSDSGLGLIPIVSEPMNYADSNIYEDDAGNVFTNDGTYENTTFQPFSYYRTSVFETAANNLMGTNPLASRGQAQYQIVVPPDGSEPYLRYTDHAYLNLTSDNPGEVANFVSQKSADFVHWLGDTAHKRSEGDPNTGGMAGYPPNIRGDLITKIDIPYRDLPAEVQNTIMRHPLVSKDPNLYQVMKDYVYTDKGQTKSALKTFTDGSTFKQDQEKSARINKALDWITDNVVETIMTPAERFTVDGVEGKQFIEKSDLRTATNMLQKYDEFIQQTVHTEVGSAYVPGYIDRNNIIQQRIDFTDQVSSTDQNHIKNLMFNKEIEVSLQNHMKNLKAAIDKGDEKLIKQLKEGFGTGKNSTLNAHLNQISTGGKNYKMSLANSLGKGLRINYDEFMKGRLVIEKTYRFRHDDKIRGLPNALAKIFDVSNDTTASGSNALETMVMSIITMTAAKSMIRPVFPPGVKSYAKALESAPEMPYMVQFDLPEKFMKILQGIEDKSREEEDLGVSATDAATLAALNKKKKKKPMNAHFKPKGKTLYERIKSKPFFNPKDIKPTFPENPPPEIDKKTGMHPNYGKQAKRYNKLDPMSANAMPPTGDPEIDAVVDKQRTKKKPAERKKDYVKLSKVSEGKKYNWREDFTNITTGNKVGQTFRHNPSGQTVTTSGALGGIETVPSTISIFGDAIPGPNVSQYGLQGFAKPIVMKRRDAEDTNKKLDASQNFAKKVNADVMMNARVEDSVDSALLSDIGYKSAEDILAEVGDVWTYEEYMAMMNAIGDKAAAKSLPITKKILEYSPTGKHPGDVPISLIDAQEAITIARQKAEDALARAWELYNKIPEPQGGFGGGQGNPTNRRGSGFDRKGALDSSGYGMDPSRDTETEARPTGLARVLTGIADLVTGNVADFDKRGNLKQAVMKAATKIPTLDRYQTPVNTMIRYDRFLNDMGKNKSNPNVKGATVNNRLDITNEISKKDVKYLESEMSKLSSKTSTDKNVLTFNNSLKALSKSNTSQSDVNAAKETIKQQFSRIYLNKAGLVATFGGTGDPKTGANPALPEVLNVKETDGYYEVTMGKSYAFRPGGSEPDSKFLKFIGVEPDTIGSDTLSKYGAPIAAKLAITGDDKYFKKKGDPFSLYNSPDMHYNVRFKIKKKKKRKVNESNTFSKIKKFKNKY